MAQKGSLFLTRPNLMTYTAGREDLFRVVADGTIKIHIGQTYAHLSNQDYKINLLLDLQPETCVGTSCF